MPVLSRRGGKTATGPFRDLCPSAEQSAAQLARTHAATSLLTFIATDIEGGKTRAWVVTSDDLGLGRARRPAATAAADTSTRRAATCRAGATRTSLDQPQLILAAS